jgi:hypothetical protein
MEQTEAKVGMRVYFGRSHGEQTLGEIVKVNRAKLKIKQLESRGTMKSYPVGTVWTVPASLCSIVQDNGSVAKLAMPPREPTEKELVAQERRNEARAARAEARWEARHS